MSAESSALRVELGQANTDADPDATPALQVGFGQAGTDAAPALEVGLFSGPDATQSIRVHIKRTYDLRDGQPLSRATELEIDLRPSPVEEDQDGGHPVGCLVGESDLIPWKPCTDIVVHGCARTPGRRPLSRLPLSLRLGAVHREVAVFGDRRVHLGPNGAPTFTDPEPFVALPLTWRRAYGGIDLGVVNPELPSDLPTLLASLQPEQHPGAYPRNPAGTGWVGCADPRSLEQLALPNFEDPRHLLRPHTLVRDQPGGWRSAPIPAGFGWVSQMWFPRASFLGLRPEIEPDAQTLVETHTGWFSDLDPGPVDGRFWSGAAWGMRALHLAEGDPIVLQGFSHDGDLRSALPAFPRVRIVQQRSELEVELSLLTVELSPDDSLATLVWVASATPSRQLPPAPPTADTLAHELLAGVDVLLDGVLVSRDLMG